MLYILRKPTAEEKAAQKWKLSACLARCSAGRKMYFGERALRKESCVNVNTLRRWSCVESIYLIHESGQEDKVSSA